MGRVINRWSKVCVPLNYMTTSAEWNLKSCAYVFMHSNKLMAYSPSAFESRKKKFLLYVTGLMETPTILS